MHLIWQVPWHSCADQVVENEQHCFVRHCEPEFISFSIKDMISNIKKDATQNHKIFSTILCRETLQHLLSRENILKITSLFSNLFWDLERYFAKISQK